MLSPGQVIPEGFETRKEAIEFNKNIRSILSSYSRWKTLHSQGLSLLKNEISETLKKSLDSNNLAVLNDQLGELEEIIQQMRDCVSSIKHLNSDDPDKAYISKSLEAELENKVFVLTKIFTPKTESLEEEIRQNHTIFLCSLWKNQPSFNLPELNLALASLKNKILTF